MPGLVGSLFHTPCPPQLPTLPANTCGCANLFHQHHLNGHFVLPVAHHQGWCCRLCWGQASSICIWESHFRSLMYLRSWPLSIIPGPWCLLLVAVVTFSRFYGGSTHLPSCIFLPISPAPVKRTRSPPPHLNPSWIPLELVSTAQALSGP